MGWWSGRCPVGGWAGVDGRRVGRCGVVPRRAADSSWVSAATTASVGSARRVGPGASAGAPGGRDSPGCGLRRRCEVRRVNVGLPGRGAIRAREGSRDRDYAGAGRDSGGRRRCAELGRGGGASDARVASVTTRAMLVLDRRAQDRDRLAATTAELAEALHGAALRRRRGPTHPARTRTTPRAGGPGRWRRCPRACSPQPGTADLSSSRGCDRPHDAGARRGPATRRRAAASAV